MTIRRPAGHEKTNPIQSQTKHAPSASSGQALSEVEWANFGEMGDTGLEPATSCVSSRNHAFLIPCQYRAY